MAISTTPIEWLRLRRLTGMDPFAQNIKERVKFPTTPEPTIDSSVPLMPNVEPVGLSGLNSRPTPRIKEYMSYLTSAPNREDYKPGKVAKILAAISGGVEGTMKGPTSGINTFKGITEMPYIEAIEDYDRKGGRLKELADLEYRGLNDEEKRLVQLESLRLKGIEELRLWAKTESDIKLSETRIKDIENRLKISGQTLEKNEVTGMLEVVDKINGTSIPIKKFVESTDDKDKRARSMFQYQSGITEGRQSRIQEDAQAAALNLESIRTMNDAELARYRTTLGREDEEIKRRLEGMSPAAQKTALELAFQQATLDHPELKENDPSAFMTEVRKRLKGVRERTRKDIGTNVDEDPFGLLEN